MNDLAARNGLASNQVSAWRQKARSGRLVLPAPEDATEFVSLMAATPEPAAAPPTGGSVEIAVRAVTVRLEPGASAERLPAVVRALAWR